MLQEKKHLEIPIKGKCSEIKFYIYPESSKAKLYEEDLSCTNASRYHLVEGCSYTYECTSDDGNIYQLEGRVPLIKAIPFGLQHILAMFVANLTPITIIAAHK